MEKSEFLDKAIEKIRKSIKKEDYNHKYTVSGALTNNRPIIPIIHISFPNYNGYHNVVRSYDLSVAYNMCNTLKMPVKESLASIKSVILQDINAVERPGQNITITQNHHNKSNISNNNHYEEPIMDEEIEDDYDVPF